MPKGKQILFLVAQMLRSFFPDLLEQLSHIEDPRKNKDSVEYPIESILCAAMMMYVFREGSRNEMNADRLEEDFMKNYKAIFKVSLPHMDTVDRVLRELKPEELEKLHRELIHILLERKVFHKFRFLKKYFLMAVDGTLEVSYAYKHCDQCTCSTYNKGTEKEKSRWFHSVLEAKLVCSNGFSISIGTEFIENPDEEFDKQDCELKAFKRLAEKLKKQYPRLAICIVADALYLNQSVFKICKKYDWAWIINQKPDSLPSIWKKVEELQNTANECYSINSHKKKTRTKNTYRWINSLQYQEFEVNWIECVEIEKTKEEEEKKTSFVYLSNISPSCFNLVAFVQSGRQRWNIENQGFNTQKKLGFGLGHKFSRVSFQASKNYYLCMQISCIINQLVDLSQTMKKKLSEWKVSSIHIWKKGMTGFLAYATGWENEFVEVMLQKIQFRFQ